MNCKYAKMLTLTKLRASFCSLEKYVKSDPQALDVLKSIWKFKLNLDFQKDTEFGCRRFPLFFEGGTQRCSFEGNSKDSFRTRLKWHEDVHSALNGYHHLPKDPFQFLAPPKLCLYNLYISFINTRPNTQLWTLLLNSPLNVLFTLFPWKTPIMQIVTHNPTVTASWLHAPSCIHRS